MASEAELTGLIVKIKADLTEYQSKLDQMQKTTTKASEEVVNKFDAVGASVSKAGVAVTAFAATAVSSAMSWGSAVNKLAKQTGMSAEESSKFLVIAKKTGIDMDTASMMFAKLAKSINAATKEQTTANAEGKKSDDVFTKLGVSTLDVNGKMRTTSEIFNDVKAKLGAMQNGWQKTALEMEIFGKSGYQLNGLINMTNSEMKEAIESARALGLILDNETASGWAKLSKEINAAKGLLSSVGITIGNELMPMFKAVINDVTAVTKAFTKMDPEVRSTLINVAKLGGEIGIASSVINKTTGIIGKATESLGLMKGATIAAINPWLRLALAIGLATDALFEHQSAKTKADGYGGGAEVRYNPITGKHEKKVMVSNLSWGEMLSGKTNDGQKITGIDNGNPLTIIPKIIAGNAKANVEFSSGEEMALNEHRIHPRGLKGDTVLTDKQLEQERKRRDDIEKVMDGVGDRFVGGDPNAGASGHGAKEKTALEKYLEQLKDVEDILQRQVDLGEKTKDQQKEALRVQLTGLQAVSVGTGEQLDKERAVYDLKVKIRSFEKDAINYERQQIERDYASKTLNEDEYYKKKLANLQREFDAEVWGSQRQLEIQKEMYSLQDQHAEKELQRSMNKVNAAQTAANAELRVYAEQLRHKQAMVKIGSSSFEADKNLEMTYLSDKELLLKQYESDVSASNKRIQAIKKAHLHNETEEIGKELESQKQLKAKYDLEVLTLDNNLGEKQKQLRQDYINENNEMIASLIKGTKDGHDILKDMWFKFVDQVVAKMFAINTETNVFTQLFGGIFGIGGTGSTSVVLSGARPDGVQGPVGTNGGFYKNKTVSSAAGGWDVPDIAGDIPAFLHRREMVLPENLADIVRGGGIGGNNVNNVTVNQYFAGNQDASVVSQIKAQKDLIVSVVEDAIANKSSTRNAIKGVR